ncbi:alpha/beta hydrolase [Lentilactobacillus sp. Marseille-Q4993]|uniref:alpha/beta hydrolase n=1 Tax=Lentilactobacillus sp. Marseille-Q4993 TaxID=3039492 RepID=UPI0024BD3E6E|nr:alpha/beta hydrolase [Lentilactobacillus sp. Marseille-Q4993]
MAANITNDIIYDSKTGQTLDVYEPNVETANQQAIILIHGGGWYQGDKKKQATIAEYLSNKGYFVFVPNYRLAPDYLYPAAQEDVLTVYDWIVASDYQFDKARIGALGMSAGGNLAIELAINRHIPIASWSGIIDLDKWIAQHQNIVASKKDAPDPNTPSDKIDQDGSNDPYYKWFVLNYVGGDTAKLKQASPAYRIDTTTGPMMIANSLNELVPMSGVFDIFAQATAFNVPTEIMTLAGGRHGNAYFDDAIGSTLAFFDKYLN